MIETIQTASAVYILVLAAYGLFLVLRATVNDSEAKYNLTGFPAVVLFVATLICAISTLAA